MPTITVTDHGPDVAVCGCERAAGARHHLDGLTRVWVHDACARPAPGALIYTDDDHTAVERVPTGHRLGAETLSRFRADGAAAHHEGAPNNPDTRAVVRAALGDIPPGHREDGETITAIREHWLHGYTGAARLHLADLHGDDYERALREEWTALAAGDQYAGLLCVAVIRSAPGFERDECRADLRQYLGDAFAQYPEPVQQLAV